MPQFQPITIGDVTYTPDTITGVSASAQDLSGSLGRRDRLYFDRNSDESNGKPYRRVIRVQSNHEIGDAAVGPTTKYQCTGTFTLVFPASSTADDRQKILDQMVGVLQNTDVKTSLVNPEWFF